MEQPSATFASNMCTKMPSIVTHVLTTKVVQQMQCKISEHMVHIHQLCTHFTFYYHAVLEKIGIIEVFLLFQVKCLHEQRDRTTREIS